MNLRLFSTASIAVWIYQLIYILLFTNFNSCLWKMIVIIWRYNYQNHLCSLSVLLGRKNNVIHKKCQKDSFSKCMYESPNDRLEVRLRTLTQWPMLRLSGKSKHIRQRTILQPSVLETAAPPS